MTESIFGPPYCKIQTAFKRDERNVIIPGEWTLPEFGYLQDNPWTWTEKVDGTNIRLYWNGKEVVIGGRTDNAQIPAPLVKALEPYTDPGPWKRVFPDADDVTIYGEGYGAKIQKAGGNYRPDQSLAVFDVRVGQWWLQDEAIRDISARLDMETVHTFGYGELSLNEAWEAIKEDRVMSHWPDAKAEGLVGRPSVDLFTRKGERLIVKLKVKDWQDYQRRGK